jgi:hypothetical protein
MNKTRYLVLAVGVGLLVAVAYYAPLLLGWEFWMWTQFVLGALGVGLCLALVLRDRLKLRRVRRAYEEKRLAARQLQE